MKPRSAPHAQGCNTIKSSQWKLHARFTHAGFPCQVHFRSWRVDCDWRGRGWGGREALAPAPCTTAHILRARKAQYTLALLKHFYRNHSFLKKRAIAKPRKAAASQPLASFGLLLRGWYGAGTGFRRILLAHLETLLKGFIILLISNGLQESIFSLFRKPQLHSCKKSKNVRIVLIYRFPRYSLIAPYFPYIPLTFLISLISPYFPCIQK